MKKILIMLIILPAFLGRAWAEEIDGQALEIFESGKMEQGLNEEELAIIGGTGPEQFDAFPALSRLWNAFLTEMQNRLRENLEFAAELFGLILFSALAGAVCGDEKIRAAVEILTFCFAAFLLAGNVDSLVSQTLETIYRLSDYSRTALPVTFTAAAAGGAVSSSAVRYAAACLAMDVMMSLSQKAVIPLVYDAMALGLANILFPNPVLSAMEALSKWAAKTIMTVAALAFTAYLSLSSIISTSVDAAAIKAMRSVVSGVLPVVGGMLSDASAAVLSAASVIRSCTGAVGLIAVSVVCAGPLALLCVKRFLFKAVAAAAEAVQNPRLQKLFSCVGSAAGMLMGLLGCNAMMLFLSFTAAMKAVSA